VGALRLGPARPVCTSYHGFARFFTNDNWDYRIISGEFTKEASEHYKYYLIEDKIPHVNIDEKIYIPLWFFLKNPNMLNLVTGSAAANIGRANGIIYDRVKDESCDEDFESGGIIPSDYKYKNYPPAWLRYSMLGLALFNPWQERLKSCDWLCGESRKWQVRKFTREEKLRHLFIRSDWRDEIEAYNQGRKKDHPGLLIDYLRARLGGRDPY
jgi:hypothetical protein